AKIQKNSTALNGQIDISRALDLMFSDPAFIDNRVASMLSRLSTEDTNPFEEVDDFQVSLLLALNTNLDIRDIFSKPFFIEKMSEQSQRIEPSSTKYHLGSNADSFHHYAAELRLNFIPEISLEDSSELRISPGSYFGGLMSTQGFAKRFIQDGTNRRAVRAAFDLFLCSKIETWKDASLDDFYIGKDVDRKPGDNPHKFFGDCRSCHAPMDSMRGAFAHINFGNDQALFAAKIPSKFNQNSQVYSSGFNSIDDTWEILLTTKTHQARFGWRGPTVGNGLLSFSSAIANSKQFQRCMTQNVLSQFCDKNNNEVSEILKNHEFELLADSFRTDGYKLKTLIKRVVTSPICD
ncbi:MAG: hypothetical protein KDD35_03775, partial [Bdellovibrionales bacterium]|nr:hypothetical protein [Bdellovibrionales bacterium]